MPTIVSILAQAAPPALGFLCCGLIFGLAIGLVVGSVILRAAVKWVLKFDLEFGKACAVVLVVGICNWVIGAVIGFGIGATFGASGVRGPIIQIIASLVSLPPGFLISALLYGVMIKYPGIPMTNLSSPAAPGDAPLSYATPQEVQNRGGPIGFSKGCMVALAVYAIGIGIALFIVLLVFGILMLTGTRF